MFQIQIYHADIFYNFPNEHIIDEYISFIIVNACIV